MYLLFLLKLNVVKVVRFFLLVAVALSIAGCAGAPFVDQQSNTRATIPKNAGFDPSNYKVMSTLIDKKAGTMSTLYANDIAMRAARSGRLRGARGLAMALVTWKQQENPYWYGNNIPGELLSVEMLSSDNRTDSIRYTLFERKKISF